MPDAMLRNDPTLVSREAKVGAGKVRELRFQPFPRCEIEWGRAGAGVRWLGFVTSLSFLIPNLPLHPTHNTP